MFARADVWDSATKTVIDYTFLETKTSLSVKTISIKPLIYVKAIYGQNKLKEIDFSFLATCSILDISWLPGRS